MSRATRPHGEEGSLDEATPSMKPAPARACGPAEAPVIRRPPRSIAARMKRAAREGVREVRRVVASPLGVPPDFLIIGAQKSGTTSLYRYLSEHPQVGASRTKEVRFLSRRWDRGEPWYRSQFPHLLRRRRARRAGRPFVTGEGSPEYFCHPAAARRAAAVAPRARLILLLRDPVARALSHHRHLARKGREPLSFEEAIRREPERLARGADADERSTDYAYLSRSRYAAHLERWLEHFARSQILVLQAEAFFERPALALRRVTDHLGIDPFTPARFDRHNFHGAYAGMSEDLTRELRARLAPDTERLFDLLGERFDWPTD